MIVIVVQYNCLIYTSISNQVQNTFTEEPIRRKMSLKNSNYANDKNILMLYVKSVV